MSRELKFRAWDGVRMNWGGFSVHASAEKLKIDAPWIPEDAPVMQYVQIKDKNGKDIYEGDILLVNNRFKEVVEFKVKKNIQAGHGQSYFNVGLSICSGYNEGDSEYLPIEVIGNIYQNPELIP